MNARGVRQRTSQKVCSDFLNFINDVLDRRGTGGAVGGQSPQQNSRLALVVGFMCFWCIMSYKTLTLRTEAYLRQQKLKAPGDSFSDVILRELPEPWETCGDVLDGLKKMQVPRPDPRLMAAVLKGRGRRSARK